MVSLPTLGEGGRNRERGGVEEYEGLALSQGPLIPRSFFPWPWPGRGLNSGPALPLTSCVTLQGHSLSPNLEFLTCKMGVIMPSTQFTS